MFDQSVPDMSGADAADDEAFDGGRRWRGVVRPALVVVAYLAMLVGVAVSFEPRGTHLVELPLVEVVLLDWLTLCALAVVTVVAGPWVVRSRDQVAGVLRTFVRDRVAAVGLVGLFVLVLVAAVGPLVVPRPEPDPTVSLNPPVGGSVRNFVPPGCVGRVVNEQCRGTWQYPLGTDGSGRDLLLKTVYGLQTSLQVGLATAVIAGGVGTVVGLVSGTVGGRVDAALMRYVDFQSAVPAFFVYLLVISAYGHDLAVMVLVFGFLSWGGLARLVRSEVLRVREELYLTSAQAAGAGVLYRLRRHVLPNVSAGVVVPVTTLVPLYVLYEAALSFLGLGDPEPVPISLGETVSSGLYRPYTPNWWDAWWIAVIPAAVLSVLLLCLLLTGDRAGELLDPKER